MGESRLAVLVPAQRETIQKPRTEYSLYCPTLRNAVMDLLCDLHTALKVLACSYFKICRQTLTGNKHVCPNHISVN